MRKRPPGAPRPDFNEITPDPSRIGGVAEAPFVRLPAPATLFQSRAARLRALAPGHVLEAYLHFLAGVVQAQASAAALGPPPPVPLERAAARIAHGFPPLAVEQVVGNPALARTLDHLLAELVLDGAPEAARQARLTLQAMPEPERLALAAELFGGAVPMDRIAESLFVAAALQVHLAGLAAQLDAKAVTPPEEGICPCCGGAPVASVVVGWTQASKARYCACSLCGTLWNYVRIKCTSCTATDGIAYQAIADQPGPVGIETCSTCHGYIKHMQQHEAPELDPLADDVASYALDLLARQAGFRRSGLNPLFLTA